MDKEETLLESFEFLPDDPRWAGAIDVVNRRIKQEDGSTKDFVDMRLRIGQGPRYTPLPRRGCEEIVSAIQDAKRSADAHFEQRVLARSTSSGPQGRRQRERIR